MMILPLDPLDRVTGSATLLVDPGRDLRMLVDCGLYQDGAQPERRNEAPFPFDPSRLDYVLLTHAHVDHVGRLPDLVEAGFRGRVVATEPTRELTELALRDSARRGVARPRLDWWTLRPDELFRRPRRLAPDVYLQAHRSAHIVGAVSYELMVGPAEDRAAQRSAWLSGDLGCNLDGDEVQPWLRHAMHPSATRDVAVVESTYGGTRRSADSPEARRARLAEAIAAGLARGGPVIVPVFAVQRAQDVLLDLELIRRADPALLDGVPIWLEGAMAHEVNRALARAIQAEHDTPGGARKPAWLGKRALTDLGADPGDPDGHARAALVDLLTGPLDAPGEAAPGRLDWRPLTRSAAAVRDAGRCVVLATGGMAEGGAVVPWLAAHLRDPRATVLFTGWCCASSSGGRLLRHADARPEQRASLAGHALSGEDAVPLAEVAATVQRLTGYSGHADQDRLLRHLLPNDRHGRRSPLARRVLLTHGEPEARRALRARLLEEAHAAGVTIDVALPDHASPGWDLERGVEVPREQILAAAGIEADAEVRALRAELRALRAAVARPRVAGAPRRGAAWRG